MSPLWTAGALLFIAFAVNPSFAATKEKPRFKAIAFDYFVLFNPNSVIPEIEKVFPGKGPELAKIWRSKQFEYADLRSMAGHYEDFFQVTGEALDFAAELL